jgi:hypothetical protein
VNVPEHTRRDDGEEPAMAYGYEIVLALSDDDLDTLVPGFEPEDDEDENDVRRELISAIPPAVREGLTAAHRTVLQARFGTVTSEESYGLVDLAAETPAGPRTFSGWSIECFGPEDAPAAVVGVSLYGRYQPNWLDWRHAAGGSDAAYAIDSPEAVEMISEARQALAAVVPAFANAPLTVVLQHY